MAHTCNCAAAAALLALLAVTSSVQSTLGQDSTWSPSSPALSDGQNAIVSQSKYSKGFCPNGTKGTLRVAGYGTKEAKSDQAKVSMNIDVTETTAIGARDKASNLANKLLGNLSAINGIGSQNAQTTSVSINPKYASSGNSITGYTYTYQINVDVKNLTSDLLSEVLDTAVSTGGDQLRIQNVAFSLSDVTTAETMVAARKLAVASAKAAADIYATELGVTVGGISSLVSSSGSLAPQSSTYDYSSSNSLKTATAAFSSESSTPVNIGQQKVADNIVVEHFICTPSA